MKTQLFAVYIEQDENNVFISLIPAITSCKAKTLQAGFSRTFEQVKHL
jgi:hypothetical protein